MMDILIFMAPAICMCIILVGICGYVGIHVIMREVIFIDIALAQIAALGVSFGIFLGLDPSDPSIFVVSLVCTLLAGYLLSLSRHISNGVPQEAFIGILYATGAAAVLLAGDRLPHGSEQVHDLMMGHLLWVTWNEVLTYLIIYLILGIIYMLLHRKLLTISQAGRNMQSHGKGLVFWDFIFFALMGILVTFAVRVAGVLLVFGFLIVPAVIGTLTSRLFKGRLLIAWFSGVLVSLLGSYLSYRLDFPTGGMVVVTLGLALFLVAVVKGMKIRGLV